MFSWINRLGFLRERRFRRLGKDEVRGLVLMLAGIIFVGLSGLTLFRVIMSSGAWLQIGFLAVIGLGFLVYGWKRFKGARG